jgi:hypothetical protein
MIIRIVTFDRPNAPGTWGLVQQWQPDKRKWDAVEIWHVKSLPDDEAQDARKQFEDRVGLPVITL